MHMHHNYMYVNTGVLNKKFAATFSYPFPNNSKNYHVAFSDKCMYKFLSGHHPSTSHPKVSQHTGKCVVLNM